MRSTGACPCTATADWPLAIGRLPAALAAKTLPSKIVIKVLSAST